MSQEKYQVVITDCDHGSIIEEKEVTSAIGAGLTLLAVSREDEIVSHCREADGIINQYAQMTRSVLEKLPRCRVIARYGVGVDNIDLSAAEELGIIVANVPDYCIDEVADQALALILTVIRKTAFFDRRVKGGTWDFREGMPIARLKGKTIGLIGSGKIGLAVSKRMEAFGVSVLAYDPYVKQEMVPFTLTDWDGLLAQSDILSIHCPLTESTRHLLGEEAFSRMRKKPVIINTSRGAIIDGAALIRALQSGQVSAAGLDVLEKEPPEPDSPLLAMDNVVLSPHVGFYSEDSISELKRRTAENVAAVLTGKWPSSVVNRGVRGKTRAAVS